MDSTPSEQLPEFLNINEAAAVLRTTPRTLRRWTTDGKVPVVRLGRKLLYRREVLLRIGMGLDPEG